MDIKRTIKNIKKHSLDGCSYAPELDFLDCCLEHDYDYGKKEISRRKADKKLRE